MTIKKIGLILFLIISISREVIAQTGELLGSDICADGIQTTNIGIANADPDKYYALYRNDEFIQLRQSAVTGKDQMLTFGTFREVGIYKAVMFDEILDGFPARLGKALSRTITISPVPVLFMGDTVKINSGEMVNYIPKADLPGTTFSWTAQIKYGKVTGLSKKGSNSIPDTLTVTDGKAACVIYTITPYSPGQVPCSGESRELVVLIKP